MTIKTRARRLTVRLGWNRGDQDTFRYRIFSALWGSGPFWARLLLCLTGRANCGNFDPPRGRDMWYREVGRGEFETTYEYSVYKAAGATSGDDGWKIFDVQDDGHTVRFGYYPSYGFYGLNRAEMKLFRKWDFWECRARGEWFGLRRWLYFRALHRVVDGRKLGCCNKRPPRESGGYRHWACNERKFHKGEHRYNNYTWVKGNDVAYTPNDMSGRAS